MLYSPYLDKPLRTETQVREDVMPNHATEASHYDDVAELRATIAELLVALERITACVGSWGDEAESIARIARAASTKATTPS